MKNRSNEIRTNDIRIRREPPVPSLCKEFIMMHHKLGHSNERLLLAYKNHPFYPAHSLAIEKEDDSMAHYGTHLG